MTILNIDEIKELKELDSKRFNSLTDEEIIKIKSIFSFEDLINNINDDMFSTFYHLIESFYDELKVNLSMLDNGVLLRLLTISMFRYDKVTTNGIINIFNELLENNYKFEDLDNTHYNDIFHLSLLTDLNFIQVNLNYRGSGYHTDEAMRYTCSPTLKNSKKYVKERNDRGYNLYYFNLYEYLHNNEDNINNFIPLYLYANERHELDIINTHIDSPSGRLSKFAKSLNDGSIFNWNRFTDEVRNSSAIYHYLSINQRYIPEEKMDNLSFQAKYMILRTVSKRWSNHYYRDKKDSDKWYDVSMIAKHSPSNPTKLFKFAFNCLSGDANYHMICSNIKAFKSNIDMKELIDSSNLPLLLIYDVLNSSKDFKFISKKLLPELINTLLNNYLFSLTDRSISSNIDIDSALRNISDFLAWIPENLFTNKFIKFMNEINLNENHYNLIKMMIDIFDDKRSIMFYNILNLSLYNLLSLEKSTSISKEKTDKYNEEHQHIFDNTRYYNYRTILISDELDKLIKNDLSKKLTISSNIKNFINISNKYLLNDISDIQYIKTMNLLVPEDEDFLNEFMLRELSRNDLSKLLEKDDIFKTDLSSELIDKVKEKVLSYIMSNLKYICMSRNTMEQLLGEEGWSSDGSIEILEAISEKSNSYEIIMELFEIYKIIHDKKVNTNISKRFYFISECEKSELEELL